MRIFCDLGTGEGRGEALERHRPLVIQSADHHVTDTIPEYLSHRLHRFVIETGKEKVVAAVQPVEMFCEGLRSLEIVGTIRQHIAPLEAMNAEAAGPAQAIERHLDSGWVERAYPARARGFEGQRQGKLEVVALK